MLNFFNFYRRARLILGRLANESKRNSGLKLICPMSYDLILYFWTIFKKIILIYTFATIRHDGAWPIDELYQFLLFPLHSKFFFSLRFSLFNAYN